jgi:AcrR family transcriptional regulator
MSPRSSGAARAPRKPPLEEAILDAAEVLFSRHGPDGVSLRQIAAAAGSSNHFAVQYHFQNKQRLIREIFERRLRSLEAKRGRLLAAVSRQGRDRDVRSLLEVLLRPIADERDAFGKRSYAAFLLGLRVFSQVGEHWAGSRDSAPLTQHVTDLLRAASRPLPELVFNDRLMAAVTVFLAAAVDCDRRGAAGPTVRGSEERYLQRSLDFGAAGMLSRDGLS